MTKQRGTLSACVAALMLAGPAHVQPGPLIPSPPVVSMVSPDHAPNSGVSGVVITGSSFTGATQVLFGPNAASFIVDSDTQITANLGSVSTTGFVDVSVTSPCGTGTLAHAFDYFVPPEVFGSPACSAVTWSGSPTLGQNYTVTVQPSSACWCCGRLLVSWSNKPHVLGGFFRNGTCRSCYRLYFAPDYHVPLAGTPPSYTFSIPSNVSLIGVNLKTQAEGLKFGCLTGSWCLEFTQVLNAAIGE